MEDGGELAVAAGSAGRAEQTTDSNTLLTFYPI